MNGNPINSEHIVSPDIDHIPPAGIYHDQADDKKDIFVDDTHHNIVEMPLHDITSSVSPSVPYTTTEQPVDHYFQMDVTRNVDEEWTLFRDSCKALFEREIEEYTGRDQQKKGSIMRSVQRKLFGEELPRGHGHKGKISTKMSLLYDELTGRQPRKRRSKPTSDSSLATIQAKRPSLRPQAISVGVIGNGDYAKLIIERLLQMRHQVISLSKDVYNAVREDITFTAILSAIPTTAFQLQTNIQSFCNMCEIILVAIPHETLVLDLYLKKNGLFDIVGSRHFIIDLCIEDLTISNKIHQKAADHKIRYYDCLIFPQPATLASFDKNQPSVFLGGMFSASEYVYNVLYTLGKTVFSGLQNQGIMYKMIVSQYMMIQQQVLKEVYATSSSLGVTDAKLLGKLLSFCANPVNIIERNVNFHLLGLHDQQSLTIPITSLLAPVKHLYSLPTTYLPVTSMASQIVENVVNVNGDAKADISHVWDSVTDTSMQPMSNPANH